MRKIIIFSFFIILLSSCQDKQLLKKFEELEERMKQSGKNLSGKNNDIIDAFEKDNTKRPEKVGPFYKKALQADTIASNFISYVDGLKTRIENGEKNLMTSGGEGKKLKEKINTTNTMLIMLLDDDDRKKVRSTLAEDNAAKGKPWEEEMFGNMPEVAVLTLLEKIKNDTKNTEAQVLETLAKAIDKNSHTFNQVAVKVIPKAGCVVKNGKFEAEVMLVAYDTKQEYEVVVEGRHFKSENGVVNFETIAKKTGRNTIKGYLEMIYDGETRQLPFETEIEVREK